MYNSTIIRIPGEHDIATVCRHIRNVAIRMYVCVSSVAIVHMSSCLCHCIIIRAALVYLYQYLYQTNAPLFFDDIGIGKVAMLCVYIIH